MPQPENERCGNCRYWSQAGLCRRFPPARPAHHLNLVFPETMPTEWCGEWKPVEQIPVIETRGE